MKPTLAAFGLAPAVLVVAMSPAASWAQSEPSLTNARLESIAASSGLEATFRGLVTSTHAPGWIAYSVPAVPGDRQSCDGGGDFHRGTTRLEPSASAATTVRNKKTNLEGPSEIFVFYRTEAGRVQKIRVISPECEIDAGGLPVRWLTDVKPPESVTLLSSFVQDGPRDKGEPSNSNPLMAIALHLDPSAGSALQKFVSAAQPRAVRKQAAFWLAAARGSDGFETLRRLVDDKDAAFRKDLTFPLSLSREPEALDLLIGMARGDASPEVRRQALFWVGQKAGARAAETIAGAIENDPDTDVKKRAVFALSQLPPADGIPRLIQVARTHRNIEVRKQAMFWLGQSNDPKALEFFEEVLKK